MLIKLKASANLDETVESFQDEKINLKIQKSNRRYFFNRKKYIERYLLKSSQGIS